MAQAITKICIPCPICVSKSLGATSVGLENWWCEEAWQNQNYMEFQVGTFKNKCLKSWIEGCLYNGSMLHQMPALGTKMRAIPGQHKMRFERMILFNCILICLIFCPLVRVAAILARHGSIGSQGTAKLYTNIFTNEV